MKNKRHKKTISTAAIAALGLIGAQSATAAIALFDDFGDGDIATATEIGAVNGGFQLVSNENGTNRPSPGTVTESSSNANTATDSANNSNSGIVSKNSFSAAGATSISATWVVTTQEIDSENSNVNVTEFLLQGGTGFRDINYFQLAFNRFGNLLVSGNDGSDVLLGTIAYDRASAADGYSVSVYLDAAGWGVSTTGLTSDVSVSNQAYSGTFDFSDLQTDLYASAMIQKRGQTGTPDLVIDSISVDVVPEPTSAALLGIAGVALILRRRK